MAAESAFSWEAPAEHGQQSIEIELTLKNRTRLERILRGYLRNQNVTAVRYHAAPPIAEAVRRAARGVGADAILELAQGEHHAPFVAVTDI